MSEKADKQTQVRLTDENRDGIEALKPKLDFPASTVIIANTLISDGLVVWNNKIAADKAHQPTTKKGN